MKTWLTKLLILFMHISLINKGLAQELKSDFHWDQLPSIPDAVGYAGSFAGVSNGALLVAGGANFPDGGAPWTGAVKKWHNQIFALESPVGDWKVVGELPVSLGYGASVTWGDAVICFGGSNEAGHFSDAFMLRYKHGEVTMETLPSMPAKIANTCGVVIGDVVYIAGGTNAPDSKESANIFWSLDLSKEGAERKWIVLPNWPGASRMLSVAGALNGEFYLLSGAFLKDGKREYLKDAFKYSPAKGWNKIADLPGPVVAAPSTAYAIGKNKLFIFGGDDGELAPIASNLKEKHPGFSTDILAYDSSCDKWSISGKIFTVKKEDFRLNPNGSVWAPVTTPLTVWNGKVILPGGEVRPATRTARVLQATPVDN